MADVKSTEKVQLTVSGILKDLDNGLDRGMIGEKYGLNKSNVKRLFQDPALKGRKVKPAPNFVLTNDTASAGASNGAAASADTAPVTKTADTAKAEAKGTW